jgi:cytochrome c553
MYFKAVGVLAAAAVIGGTLMIAALRSAEAKPEYAAQTGKACGACHKNPAGGGELKPLGAAFQANGHKLPGKK